VPHEVVKQKLQTGEYSSTIGAIGTMWAESGMRAFFPMGGVTIQMMRDIPYAIVTLLSYECLREHWVRKAAHESPHRDMIAGGLAGGLGSWATNPMDVLKTRMQIDDGGVYGGSVLICASKTLHDDGPMAFWRGTAPRLMHKIPANATFFVFYEFFRKILGVNEGGTEK
jgi:solute carrier family 25 S-adenosylmethionine transporter 26